MLGSDPFADEGGADPFAERLDALSAGARRAPAPAAPFGAAPPRAPGAQADSGSRVPRLDALDPVEPAGALERLLDEDARRRLAALAHMLPEGAAYDAFGFAPDATRRAFPWFYALYRGWFRVESQGHEHLPAEGAAVLAGNHGGLLPFDGAMTVLDVLLATDPPRLPRAIVERWAGTLPWVNVFFARVGQVVGTRENFAALLDAGHMVLVYPEGVDGIRKPWAMRYRLRPFHVGFVEQALRARVPIVPVATVGSDDQAPILYDLEFVARRLGLPVAPITPTFPWLGPLGLLPYPVRYRIVYGEPLRFHEEHGPEAAGDPRRVRYLASRVRREIQRLLDRSR